MKNNGFLHSQGFDYVPCLLYWIEWDNGEEIIFFIAVITLCCIVIKIIVN